VPSRLGKMLVGGLSAPTRRTSTLPPPGSMTPTTPFLPLLRLALLAGAASLTACGSDAGPEPEDGPGEVATQVPPPTVVIDPDLLEAFPPLAAAYPGDSPADEAAVARGEGLFRSTELSADRQTSCASCHVLADGGDDGLARSRGANGAEAPRNAPTLWNVASYASFGWDARADSLEAFTAAHLLDAWATGLADEEAVVAAPRGELGVGEIVGALSAYQRSLVRPSRWDRFLGGEEAALTDPEREGFLAFLESGCAMCHTGTNFGGDDLQMLGMADDWPGLEDPGRAAVTGDDSDAGMFRTAPLRGLPDSGPYGHAGSVDDLGEMVRMMAEYQLGGELDDEQVAKIVNWLEALR
jgi:cytochrome c peroxidase